MEELPPNDLADETPKRKRGRPPKSLRLEQEWDHGLALAVESTRPDAERIRTHVGSLATQVADAYNAARKNGGDVDAFQAYLEHYATVAGVPVMPRRLLVRGFSAPEKSFVVPPHAIATGGRPRRMNASEIQAWLATKPELPQGFYPIGVSIIDARAWELYLYVMLEDTPPSLSMPGDARGAPALAGLRNGKPVTWGERELKERVACRFIVALAECEIGQHLWQYGLTIRDAVNCGVSRADSARREKAAAFCETFDGQSATTPKVATSQDTLRLVLYCSARLSHGAPLTLPTIRLCRREGCPAPAFVWTPPEQPKGEPQPPTYCTACQPPKRERKQLAREDKAKTVPIARHALEAQERAKNSGNL